MKPEWMVLWSTKQNGYLLNGPSADVNIAVKNLRKKQDTIFPILTASEYGAILRIQSGEHGSTLGSNQWEISLLR